MKIAIISDTHDNSPAIVWIIEYLNENKISIALHGGDIINPGIVRRFNQHYQGHLHFVFGNNDGELSGITAVAENSDKLTCYNREMDIELEKRKIFMNHYSTIAEFAAQSGQYDICIGGHDHEYRVKSFGKTLFINPGNTVTKDKWLAQGHEKVSSFVILDLKTLEYKQIIVPF